MLSKVTVTKLQRQFIKTRIKIKIISTTESNRLVRAKYSEMETKIFFIIITSCILGHAIAWAFTPFQWLKQLAAITTENFLDLEEAGQDAPLTRWQNVHRLIAKAVNCATCMAFWSSVALCCINPSWWAPIVLICSYTTASIVERLLNSQE